MQRWNLHRAPNSALFAYAQRSDSGIRLHRRCPVRSSAAVGKAQGMMGERLSGEPCPGTGRHQPPAVRRGLKGHRATHGDAAASRRRRGIKGSSQKTENKAR